MQFRLGSFKLNWVAVEVSAAFALGFVIYFAGYSQFAKLYMDMYYKGEENPLTSIQWYLVSCPITMLLVTLAYCVIASFESRQLVLAICVPLAFGFLGFTTIAAWVGTNLTRFRSANGWEECKPDARCSTLKNGMNAFLVGAIFCALAHLGQIFIAYLRLRDIKGAEANYASLPITEYIDADVPETLGTVEEDPSEEVELDMDEIN